MKRLLLVRHAKSDWTTGADDFDRPLNKRGQRDAPFLGQLISKLDYPIDVIVSSPAMRAKLTAEALHKKNSDAELEFIENFYLGSQTTFMQALHDLDPEFSTAVFVGHNPAMEFFAAFLAQINEDSLHMRTGGTVYFEFDCDDWKNCSPDNAVLEWFIRPKLMWSFMNDD